MRAVIAGSGGPPGPADGPAPHGGGSGGPHGAGTPPLQAPRRAAPTIGKQYATISLILVIYIYIYKYKWHVCLGSYILEQEESRDIREKGRGRGQGGGHGIR